MVTALVTFLASAYPQQGSDTKFLRNYASKDFGNKGKKINIDFKRKMGRTIKNVFSEQWVFVTPELQFSCSVSQDP